MKIIEKNIIYIIGLVLFVIVGRLVYINFVSADFLHEQQKMRTERRNRIIYSRGTITDRNGIPLAISAPISSIWANTLYTTNITDEEIKKLSHFLRIPSQAIVAQLTKHKSFIYIKRGISPQIADSILNLNINGIYVENSYKRFYPAGVTSSHLIGLSDIDNNGIAGIEYAYNKHLTGTSGIQETTQDIYGNAISVNTISPISGKELTLSIDNRLQNITFNLLSEQILKTHAKAGSAIILDANTGEVLAVVNNPSFNPNSNKPDIKMLNNRAITDVYDPGSIIKPLIIAKAIDDNLVTQDTVIDTKSFVVGNKLIKDEHLYSKMTISDVIQKSSDVGAAKIALQYSSEELWKYYNNLWFGRKLMTGFPGETAGILRYWKKWYPVDHALLGYGYGISVSLLQMAHAYTVFTNNGCLLPISFIKIESAVCEKIISKTTANIMANILYKTAESGTGINAKTKDYTVAGKTGTAQILDGIHYTDKKHIASFVGFAPIHNPQIIVAVMIEEPSGAGFAAQVTAPVFSKIVQSALHVLGVHPDK